MISDYADEMILREELVTRIIDVLSAVQDAKVLVFIPPVRSRVFHQRMMDKIKGGVPLPMEKFTGMSVQWEGGRSIQFFEKFGPFKRLGGTHVIVDERVDIQSVEAGMYDILSSKAIKLYGITTSKH